MTVKVMGLACPRGVLALLSRMTENSMAFPESFASSSTTLEYCPVLCSSGAALPALPSPSIPVRRGQAVERVCRDDADKPDEEIPFQAVAPMGAKSFDIGYPPMPCLWSGGPSIM
jgi:hypothetical protein